MTPRLYTSRQWDVSRFVFTVVFGVFSFAPAARAQSVCAEDAAQALTQAISYHRRIGLAGAAAKSLEDSALARARWCPEGDGDAACRNLFATGAQTYVNRLDEAALLLYARDDAYVCAFMYSKGEPMRYARTAMARDAFDASADGLRRRFALELEPEEASSKRAVTRRKLDVLKYGDCDIAAIGAAEIGRGFSVEAAANASTATAEATLTAALFPKALHRDLARAKHLSIVPFGPLSTLPFAALKPFGDERQAVDLFSINFLLFAGEVRRPQEAWLGVPKTPLIFGNPQSLDPKRAQCVSSLPWAEKEASFVQSIFGGVYLERDKATRRAFETQAKAADMLYFAAHGLAGVKHGIDDSFIALADTNLTARDVQRVSQFGFRTRLVVMSACQTGLGRIDEFGVIGLARTFLDIGAQNTVMTAWNVDDESTARLMETFARNLAAHQPSDALVLAQRKIKKSPQTAAPFYWEGFSVYGNRLSRLNQPD